MQSAKAVSLSRLRESMEANWQKLPLVSHMEDLIPGDGNPDAEILLIGEAGGRHEAEQRRPFVGMAGKIMTRELEKTGIARSEVWISNVVKCRPPENRDPTPAEIAAFAEYLDQEIAILQPLLIVTLGRFSMGKFLPDVKISQVHGKLFRVSFGGRAEYVLPMYHPSAAQRRKSVMADFMADFARLPIVMERVRQLQSERNLYITDSETVEIAL